MPDQILHQLTTERGTYRLVSPRDGFAYVMQGSWKLGEIHRRPDGWVGYVYAAVFAVVLCDMGRLFQEFEASYLARV